MSTEEKPSWWSAFYFLALLIAYPIWAFAMVKLWGWFIVPLGAPAITLPHAIGIAITTKCFNGVGSRPSKNDGWSEYERELYVLFGAYISPLLTLVGGAILRALFLVKP